MKLSPALLALLRSLENALLLAGISAALVFVGAAQTANTATAWKAAGFAALAIFAKGGLQAVNDALNRAKTLVPTDPTSPPIVLNVSASADSTPKGMAS